METKRCQDKLCFILIGSLALMPVPLVGASDQPNSDQPQCQSHEGSRTFTYRCTLSQEDLCIPGRHVQVAVSNCSLPPRYPGEICVPCEKGTFMDSYNSCDECKPHKQCGPDEMENPDSPPTASKDRECIPRPQPSVTCPSCPPPTCAPCPICSTEVPGSQGTQPLATRTSAKPDDTSSTAHPTEEESVTASARRERDHWAYVAIVFIMLFSFTFVILVGVCLWIKCQLHLPSRCADHLKKCEITEEEICTPQGSCLEVVNGSACGDQGDTAINLSDEAQEMQQQPQGNSLPEQIPNGSPSLNREKYKKKDCSVGGKTPSSVPDEDEDDTHLNEREVLRPSMQPTLDYSRALSAYETAEEGHRSKDRRHVFQCNEEHIDFVKDNISSKTRWDLFGKLNIPLKDVEDSDIDHKDQDIRERTRCVLIEGFLRKKLDPSINKLLRALEDTGNCDVLNKFREKFNVR